MPQITARLLHIVSCCEACPKLAEWMQTIRNGAWGNTGEIFNQAQVGTGTVENKTCWPVFLVNSYHRNYLKRSFSFFSTDLLFAQKTVSVLFTFLYKYIVSLTLCPVLVNWCNYALLTSLLPIYATHKWLVFQWRWHISEKLNHMQTRQLRCFFCNTSVLYAKVFTCE